MVQMRSFKKPRAVNDALFAFPANVIGDYLPKMVDIPREFTEAADSAWPWLSLSRRIFFQSARVFDDLRVKEGIDRTLALRHLSVCLRSYEPKHEHKEAGVAYLLSLWFEPLEVEARSASPEQ